MLSLSAVASPRHDGSRSRLPGRQVPQAAAEGTGALSSRDRAGLTMGAEPPWSSIPGYR